MADVIRKMAGGHKVADIDGVIDEVAAARGESESLGGRLDGLDTYVSEIRAELARTTLQSTDLNTLTKAGNYSCNANSYTYDNAPADLSGTFTLLMIRATAGNRYFQIILSWTNPGTIYIRTLTTGSTPTATAWKTLTAV